MRLVTFRRYAYDEPGVLRGDEITSVRGAGFEDVLSIVAGGAEVFALDDDIQTRLGRNALGCRDRRGPPHVFSQEISVFGYKLFIAPGAIELTRMRFSATSCARLFINSMSPPFDAA